MVLPADFQLLGDFSPFLVNSLYFDHPTPILYYKPWKSEPLLRLVKACRRLLVSKSGLWQSGATMIWPELPHVRQSLSPTPTRAYEEAADKQARSPLPTRAFISHVHPLHDGSATFLWQRATDLSLVARGQVAIVGVPNRLNYCVIFIVHNLEMWPRAASWKPVHLYRMIREERSVLGGYSIDHCEK